MLISDVVPHSTQSVDYVIKSLTDHRDKLSSVWSGGAAEVLLKYQRWATGASEFFAYMFDHDAVERLVLTRRYWLLATMFATEENGPLIQDLVSAEAKDRQREFDALIKAMGDVQKGWANVTATPVVADTNVYLHYEQDFDEVDWRDVTGLDSVRLLVPAVVVHELDKAKRTPRSKKVSETNPEWVSTRARHSVNRLRALLAEPEPVAALPNGVQIELLLDDRRHRPISDPDSEIVDRALAAQTLIGRSVHVLTNDGGMQFNAGVAGLGVIPLFDQDTQDAE